MRNETGSPDSLAATFTLTEGRTERQTRIKLESLERRLRANEKARKDVELEAEKWKDKANKCKERIPTLEVELAEACQSRDEWMAKSQELEVINRQLTIEKDELQQKLAEIDDKTIEFMRKSAVIMNLCDEEVEQDTSNHESTVSVQNLKLEKIEEKLKHFRAKSDELARENQNLRDQIHQLNSQLSANQDNVTTLMGELETTKTQSTQMQGICKRELEIRQDHETRSKHDINLMNATIIEQKHELDVLRAELKCVRSYSQELATSNRNNVILLKSAESEKNCFLETLTVLLNENIEPNENNIKRAIRDLVRDRNNEQTLRLEAEKKATSVEATLIEQAKHQRNALFRARLSEEEYSKAEGKIEDLEQELMASDLERKSLEHRIDSFEKTLTRISEMLNVNTGSLFDGIIERIEELIQQETVYRVVMNENRLISDNILKTLHSSKKETNHSIQSNKDGKKPPNATKHTLKTIDKMDKLNKDLLATVTLETLKVSDMEKSQMRKRMNEQEQKIRQLEREKKEGERIRSIIAKWEKRNTPKTKSSLSFTRKSPSMEHIRPKSQASNVSSTMSHI